MRKVGFTFSMLLALAASGLFTWAVLRHEVGYAVASAMLTASALYAGVRGPHYCPETMLTKRRVNRRDAVQAA